MNDEYQRTDRDGEAGSIGIGAMIVFIALILVAAVASTIIIKTAEELQQNAESTSDDTRKEISGKINIIQVVVNGSDGTNIDSLIVTAKVASGSMDVLVSNVDWMITCGGGGDDGVSGFGLITSSIGDQAAWGGAATTQANADYIVATDGNYEATDELTAGTTFKFDINLDKNTAGVAASGACNTFAGAGDSLALKMIVDSGGTTISTLNIGSVISGKVVT
jgi:flagellin FlaB